MNEPGRQGCFVSNDDYAALRSWMALDRATRLAHAGHLPDEHTARRRVEAAFVRHWAGVNWWSESTPAYGLLAGSDTLDAAVLFSGRTGFDRGSRLKSTIEALISELGGGPYLSRYSGRQREEGAFMAGTFWIVAAFVRTGRIDRAASLLDEAVGFGNHLGIFSEQVDPATGGFLGKVRQSLSHLTPIKAAHASKNTRPPEAVVHCGEALESR